MDFKEESRMIAKSVLEELGGLEYIAKFELPRTGENEPSIWNVYLCMYCYAPIWHSTTVSESGEDGWRISDFNFWEAAFGTCNICEALQSQMSPSAVALTQRNAVANLILWGKRNMRWEKLR